MNLAWAEDLNSGIDEIDHQHQQIIDLLNQVIALQKMPDKQEELTSKLLDFSKALHDHFDFEEKLLAQQGYKGLKNHKAGHEEISDLLNSLTMSVMLENNEISEYELNRIVNWFQDHLTSEDKRYFKSINKA